MPSGRTNAIGIHVLLLSGREDRGVTTGREPPPWTPKVAVAAIPIAILGAAVGGVASDVWALAALLSGAFVVVLFIGIWMSPSTTGGLAAVVGLSLASAVVLAGAMVGFGAIVVRLPDAGTSTTTTTTTVPTATSPSTGSCFLCTTTSSMSTSSDSPP